MVHYAPIDAELFQFPLLEGHGHLPDLGQAVPGTRILVTGSYALQGPQPDKHFLSFDRAEELQAFLPTIGTVLEIKKSKPRSNSEHLSYFGSPTNQASIYGPFPNLDFILRRSDLLQYRLHGTFTLQPLYGSSPQIFLERFEETLPPPFYDQDDLDFGPFDVSDELW